MTEWMNNNSGWLSILFLVLSIPLSIFANLITPKIQLWLASQSKDSILEQIAQVERMITLADKMIAEPSFAIAKFTGALLRAIGRMLTLIFFLIVVAGAIFIASNQNIFPNSLLKDLSNPQTSFVIPIFIAFFIPFFVLLIGTTGRIWELQDMVYWIEQNAKWKQEKIKEIEKLKKELTKFAT